MFAKKLVNLRSIFSWPSFHETLSTCNFTGCSKNNPMMKGFLYNFIKLEIKSIQKGMFIFGTLYQQ